MFYQSYAIWHNTSIMRVVLIAAVTADGYIGRDSHHVADWTSNADKKAFVALTKELGVMVMGARTFDTIGKALPGRKTIVYTTRPELKQRSDIATTVLEPANLIHELEKSGANGLAVCGGASVYTQFMAAGVVDELHLTIEPVVFGAGVRLFEAEMANNLSIKDVKQLTYNVIQVQYIVHKSA